MNSEILNEVEKLIQEKTQQARQMIFEGCERNEPINAITNLLLATMLSEREVTQRNKDWVPCSERLPEEERDVLVCFKHGDISIDNRVAGQWERYWDNDIIAWMPLPEPYGVKP